MIPRSLVPSKNNYQPRAPHPRRSIAKRRNGLCSPTSCNSPGGPRRNVRQPGHVVMYLGSGQIIQAPQTGENVQIDPLDLASVVVATRPADLSAHP